MVHKSIPRKPARSARHDIAAASTISKFHWASHPKLLHLTNKADDQTYVSKWVVHIQLPFELIKHIIEKTKCLV